MTKWTHIIDRIEDLHSPFKHVKGDGDEWIVCNHCKIHYPCPTIQIIIDEVGK
jgi:hypothetical protein